MIHGGFAANLAAVTMDDALHGGQSYSGALKLFRQVQALKDAEQLVDVPHVKAGAVVLHEHFKFLFLAVRYNQSRFRPASRTRLNLTAFETRLTTTSLSMERSP